MYPPGHRSLPGPDADRLRRRGTDPFRREHVGFVFQFYNLIPSLTARENVALITEIAANPMTPEEALSWWTSEIGWTIFPRSCPAANNNAWRSLGRRQERPPFCCATNRPGARREDGDVGAGSDRARQSRTGHDHRRHHAQRGHLLRLADRVIHFPMAAVGTMPNLNTSSRPANWCGDGHERSDTQSDPRPHARARPGFRDLPGHRSAAWPCS